MVTRFIEHRNIPCPVSVKVYCTAAVLVSGGAHSVVLFHRGLFLRKLEADASVTLQIHLLQASETTLSQPSSRPDGDQPSCYLCPCSPVLLVRAAMRGHQ